MRAATKIRKVAVAAKFDKRSRERGRPRLQVRDIESGRALYGFSLYPSLTPHSYTVATHTAREITALRSPRLWPVHENRDSRDLTTESETSESQSHTRPLGASHALRSVGHGAKHRSPATAGAHRRHFGRKHYSRSGALCPVFVFPPTHQTRELNPNETRRAGRRSGPPSSSSTRRHGLTLFPLLLCGAQTEESTTTSRPVPVLPPRAALPPRTSKGSLLTIVARKPSHVSSAQTPCLSTSFFFRQPSRSESSRENSILMALRVAPSMRPRR